VLVGEIEALYVPALLSMSTMKFSFASICSIVMSNSLISCCHQIFICLSYYVVINVSRGLWSVSTITLWPCSSPLKCASELTIANNSLSGVV